MNNTLNLTGLSLEELSNLLAQAQAQVSLSSAQQTFETTSTKVRIDSLVKQAVNLATNITALQNAISALNAPTE